MRSTRLRYRVAGLAGALLCASQFSSSAVGQCNTTCPGGGIPQNDACGGLNPDPNGGCNFDPVAYQDIGAVGLGSPKTVCGTIGTWDAASRDLDWYRFSLAVPSRVQVTMVHTAGGTPGAGTPLPNATIFIRNGDDCATAVTEFAAASATCPFVSSEVVLPAGNHVVIFTVNAFAPNEPACPNNYVGTIAVTALVPEACVTATNSCAEVSATGGCNDSACCDQVCSVFGSCCSVAWDADCVEIAVDICGLFVYTCNTNANSPPNDCATDATKAVYDLPYAFDTTNANTDGPQNEPCDQTRDVWYLVFAPDDGELTIDVSSPAFDSTIGVYAVGQTQNFDPEFLPQLFIGCVDVLGTGGEIAILTDAAANNWYLIRIAGFANQAGSGEVEFRFTRVIYNTGNTFPVLFDAANGGNYTLTNLGWSSGNLNAANAQRWAAQAFTAADPGTGLIWLITAIHAYGFTPAGVQNDTLDFRIWNRNGFANPNGEVQIAAGSVPFPAPFDIPGGAANEDHEIDLSATPVEIDPGDYWLSVYAGGVTAPVPPANFAWFTNAQNGIPTVDGGGNAFMWRSQLFPVPGFLVYTLPATTLQQQAGLNPLNLYNAGFRILGVKGAGGPDTCLRVYEKLNGAWDQIERAKGKLQNLPPGVPLEVAKPTLLEVDAQLLLAKLLLIAAKLQILAIDPESCPEGVDYPRIIQKLEDAIAILEAAIQQLRDIIYFGAPIDVYLPRLINKLDAVIALLDQILKQLSGPPPVCPWDLNGDGCVNGADLGILLSGFEVLYDGGDLGELLGAWGPCPGGSCPD